MITPRVRSKLACEMVGLEPQKLNEAIHQGHLPCAAATKPGSARIFDLDGLVMLSIFSQMLRNGMSTAGAGKIACDVYSQIRLDPQEKVSEAAYFFPPKNYPEGTIDVPVLLFQDDGTVFIENGIQAKGITTLFSDHALSIRIPVRAMRELGKATMQYQMNNPILGEE